jgi:hypothetical protein
MCCHIWGSRAAVKAQVIWVIMPCRTENSYWHLGEAQSLFKGSNTPQLELLDTWRRTYYAPANSSNYLAFDRAQHSTRLESLEKLCLYIPVYLLKTQESTEPYTGYTSEQMPIILVMSQQIHCTASICLSGWQILKSLNWIEPESSAGVRTDTFTLRPPVIVYLA